ncbi:MAG: Tm-1-like ATP-binding domain-containing protein, partial [Betaproteobacteria bacterium AqS2]|nr:Tm-1-like ATP-binding domain-containing protein [Betaproteobacteria bacterium AqS2]
ANGYGGAALARAIAEGGVDAVVDLTTHELSRLLLGGDHALAEERFAAAGEAGLPQVVLPGGLNFIGLNDYASVAEAHRARPHYRHSRVATHVAVTADEIARLAETLAQSLRASKGPAALIVPLGGFSSQDAPGGAIEDPGLRAAFLDAAAAALAGGGVELVETPAHINDPAVTELIAGRLAAYNCLPAA